MGENTSKSWIREIFVGITVAVASALILTWLGLQNNEREANNQIDVVPQTIVDLVTPTVPQATSPFDLLNLSGTWQEPGGNVVSITQSGARVTLRMPYLEAMGFPPSLTTQSGTVEESPDPAFLAYVNASNGTTSAQFWVTQDGNRMEGWVSNGFSNTPAILIRAQ